ncbi:DUF305 domain-containing protein [Mycobacterium sp. MS1601]|uniref:DUF305 domain-containing protein n=1 Tax=Mycobacterium sp. MS1601 TaxID=1936029 RepID=UPI0009797519|nr:DUF305 domain-containing protein [Mycobacterium sp. MS1601]AQA02441.1 DUF305 domain-containing protein [Mycobacterium sp. MS1601]
MQPNRYGFSLAALTAAALVVSACSNTATDTQAASAPPPPSTSVSSGAVAHNQADMMFAMMMIPHHQQAIEMSDLLLGKQGIDPRVTSLAQQIKDAQGPEIDTMQAWLREWGSMSMPSHDMGMPGMSGSGHGMMSDDDMSALAGAQGADATRLFLEQMIQHHEGAITMAQSEIDNGGYPAAIEMATNIVSSQQAEITTMREILGSR